MHVHAAIEGRNLDRHRGEVGTLGHKLAEAGGGKAKVALRHGVEAVFGVGITQVIGKQGVHHHAAEGQSMAQQDQPVVLGVLKAFGVLWAGQPGG